MGQEKGAGNRLVDNFHYASFLDNPQLVRLNVIEELITDGHMAKIRRPSTKLRIFRKRVDQWALNHGYKPATSEQLDGSLWVEYLPGTGRCKVQCSGKVCRRGVVSEPMVRAMEELIMDTEDGGEEPDGWSVEDLLAMDAADSLTSRPDPEPAVSLKDRLAHLMEAAQAEAAREGFKIIWRLE